MATMTINNMVFEGTVTELMQIRRDIEVSSTVAVETAKPKASKPAKAAKPAKAEKASKPAKVGKIELDFSRCTFVNEHAERSAKQFMRKCAKAGFETRAKACGDLQQIYPCGVSRGKGRTAEFRNCGSKLWNHSMKYGSFWRAF